MKQQTPAAIADKGAGFERYHRATWRDLILTTVEEIVPWAALYEVLESHYPKAGNGNPLVGLERVLDMYFVLHWSHLAGEACEEALLDSMALRRFVGIDLSRECMPDGTMLLRSRRLLEQHQLGEKLIATVGEVLQARRLKVATSTIVDATIAAPSSKKNADKARDAEMHQTDKAKQWHFGIKMRIGVDNRTGLTHRTMVTAANVHDKHPLSVLLYGADRRVYDDSAYASQKALIATMAPRGRDFTDQRVRRKGEINEVERSKNRNKSKVRARVRHVFAVVKWLWSFTRVCYRGQVENATRSFVALGLANIYLARQRLMA